MAMKLFNDNDIQDIADAIRSKNGSSDTYTVSEMAQAIEDIPSGGGSSGGIVLASGSFTGNNNYVVTIPIGNKMAQTNFIAMITTPNESEFPYDNKYKFTFLMGAISSNIGYYDLSTNGTNKAPIITNGYKVNNEGTISSPKSTYFNSRNTIRYTSSAGGTFNQFKITRNNSGFELYIGNTNSAYNFPSTITYNYEIIYFGNNPSTEIVEVV